MSAHDIEMYEAGQRDALLGREMMADNGPAYEAGYGDGASE
jgi:hypothetical protein